MKLDKHYYLFYRKVNWYVVKFKDYTKTKYLSSVSNILARSGYFQNKWLGKECNEKYVEEEEKHIFGKK